MKRFIGGFLIGGVIFGCLTVFAYEIMDNPYPIMIDGVRADIQGYNIDGRTYFQLRDIGDKVGFAVDFKEDTILIDKEEKNVERPSNGEYFYSSDGINAGIDKLINDVQIRDKYNLVKHNYSFKRLDNGNYGIRKGLETPQLSFPLPVPLDYYESTLLPFLLDLVEKGELSVD